MKPAGLFAVVLVLSAILSGCGGSQQSGVPEQPIPTSLSKQDLFLDGTPSSPANDGGFAPSASASAPDESFEGRLELADLSSNGRFEALTDSYGVLGESVWKHLPPFSFEFVQDGGYLIPAQQGLVHTGHPVWNYIVGPGRVWKLSEDSGYSRASFPFALVEKNQNCVHNGAMTFLFSNSKTPNVSKVRYQITQETCGYSKFNLWGQVSATYSPHSVANAAALKADHAEEAASRLPTRPLSALTTDFPGSGINPAALVSDHRYPADITFYGLLVNGVNYVSGCQTRFGEYSFCSEMRVPSYSTAKSVFNSVAMMRLGQLYGSGVYSQQIRDYVPEHTLGGDWSTVTFDNGLDMATGNYLSADYMSDENGSASLAFLRDVSYSDKIRDAFAPFPARTAPGTTWVYQSVASFITNQAMNSYLQQLQGGSADIFNLVRDDVFKPLHISKGGLTTLRTDNSETGRAIGALGLFYVQDDIAKLVKLLNNDNGAINGSQVLDSARVQESLFRNPASLGLPVPDTGTPAVLNTTRYNNGFWAKRVTSAEFPQTSCDFWMPYMSGWGGITVAMLPNGVSFYVFGDQHEYNFGNALLEAIKLGAVCHP